MLFGYLLEEIKVKVGYVLETNWGKVGYVLENTEAKTPGPENKPYRLINIPFYYIGQMTDILDEVLSKLS